jgi:hypothetical protein
MARVPRRAKQPPVAVGWREWVSSLHAYDVDMFERDGRAMVRFKVHPVQRETRTVVTAEAALKEWRTVKSSSGHAERRLVITSDVMLMGRRWPIEITLTRRDAMGFRMLLGRRALKGRFLVDSARSFVGGPKPNDPSAPNP